MSARNNHTHHPDCIRIFWFFINFGVWIETYFLFSCLEPGFSTNIPVYNAKCVRLFGGHKSFSRLCAVSPRRQSTFSFSQSSAEKPNSILSRVLLANLPVSPYLGTRYYRSGDREGAGGGRGAAPEPPSLIPHRRGSWSSKPRIKKSKKNYSSRFPLTKGYNRIQIERRLINNKHQNIRRT